MRRWAADLVWPLAVFGALAFVPKLDWSIPKVFDGAISSPGTLQLLGVCLAFGGLALTYDLLFGFTGLLSFGHAFYFAVGVYMTAIAAAIPPSANTSVNALRTSIPRAVTIARFSTPARMIRP